MYWAKPHPSGVTLSVALQPKSKRLGPIDLKGEVLRWAVHAPPIDGAANKELIESVSELLGVSKSSVTLLRGEKGRKKVILVQGLQLEQVIKVVTLHTSNQA